MYRGNVDGSGVATFTGFLPNFICTARDPNGGFYIVLDDCPECVPRIYHLPDGATDKADATVVETTPSLAEAQAAQNDPLSFVFCSMAAASDGTLYIQSFQQLWKVSPERQHAQQTHRDCPRWLRVRRKRAAGCRLTARCSGLYETWAGKLRASRPNSPH